MKIVKTWKRESKKFGSLPSLENPWMMFLKLSLFVMKYFETFEEKMVGEGKE